MIGRSHAQGPIQETGDPLDLAIEGEGYFQVKGPGGQPALTRDGSFAIDANGTIVNAEGNSLEPPIKLPAGVSPDEVKIGTDGSVSAGKRRLGQIKLVTVASPDHLLAGGGGTLTPTTASGTVQPVAPTAAKIRQGALEGSNVDMSKEMALMVTPTRLPDEQLGDPDRESDDVDRQPATSVVSVPLSSGSPLSSSGLPAVNQTLEPAWVPKAPPPRKRPTRRHLPSNRCWSKSSRNR